MFYVYIIKWTRYYVGYTNNIERRLKQHKNGNTPSTNKYWDISLVWYFVFYNKIDAINMEKKIKKSGHIERYLSFENFIKII